MAKEIKTSEPEPRDSVEEIMKLIWEGENKNNTWKNLIWNDYPLSDLEAKKIYARLEATAKSVMSQLIPYA